MAKRPQNEWEELAEDDPEVIVAMPCGYDIAKTREELPVLTSKPGWSDLRAVRARRVYLLEGSQFFNRPGPRLVESVEILAEVLHPGVFQYGHEGAGWERL